MSFLDSLKNLIGIKIDLSKLKSFSIHLLSDNTIHKTVIIDKKTININVSTLNQKDMPAIKKLIRQAISENKLLIEEKANTRLQDIAKTKNNPDSTSLLEFFKGKISNNDLEILRASLYVKTVYGRGDQVGELKDDIITRYGARGRNIVNLCTAGYFSSLIKPLFEDMVDQQGFKPSWYLEVFDTIIDQSPVAVFVSSSTTKDQLLSEVEARIRINKRYGIHYLNIHGISEQNVEKIEFVLGRLKNNFTNPPDIDSGKRYIIVTIYF